MIALPRLLTVALASAAWVATIATLAHLPNIPATHHAPACQVHVWDGDPPYDCYSPAAEADAA